MVAHIRIVWTTVGGIICWWRMLKIGGLALTKRDMIGRAKKIIPNLHAMKKLEKSADYIEVAKPFSLNP